MMMSFDSKHKKRLEEFLKWYQNNAEREMKRNDITLEENLKNGVNELEESLKTTNLEYFKEVNKDNIPIIEDGEIVGYRIPKIENETNKEKYIKETKSKRFIQWIVYDKVINTEIIQNKIKENLKIPLKSIIRYDKIKCSKNCKHDNHYYFYAYWWDHDTKKVKKKYIGNHLPIPFNLLV